MKYILMAAALWGAMLSGCKSSQVGSGTDDVYASPAEEKKLRQLASEEKAKRAAEERARIEQEPISKGPAKEEDNNPYYKDPHYSADDYYDYAYASRLNRFHSPLYGAGYYDPFYTNMYSYNQNPAFYGTSIYSSYNYGMPSTMFNGYSMGISTSWGYGNNYCYPSAGYDPFCYSNGYGYNPWSYQPYGYGNAYYNGYSNAYYSGYSNGYYNGYNNGVNSGYYYNKLDPNSGYGRVDVGPRQSAGGSNTGRGGSAMQLDNNASKYFESVAEEQAKTQRFSSTERPGRENSQGRIQGVPEGGRRSVGGSQPAQPAQQPQQQNTERGKRSGSSGRIHEESQDIRTQPRENNQPRENKVQNNNINQTPANNNSGRGRDDGGSNQPRNSSGGGNTKPRR